MPNPTISAAGGAMPAPATDAARLSALLDLEAQIRALMCMARIADRLISDHLDDCAGFDRIARDAGRETPRDVRLGDPEAFAVQHLREMADDLNEAFQAACWGRARSTD